MKVKVFSTQMGEREVETEATTWEGLQGDLKKQGISFNKMKAVIGETKLTLEAGGAMLPAQGFTLFLMNKKTKAGLGKEFNSYKYGQLRGTVRVILTDDPSSAELFNKGKNYTTKKGDELLKLLKKYKGSVPTLDKVEKFLADAKAAKGKKKPKAKKETAKPKGVTVGKNEVVEPKRGFGADEASKKTEKKTKKNSIIEKAQQAAKESVKEVEATMKETPKTVEDMVKDIQDSKKSSSEHEGLNILNNAVSLLKDVMINDVDRILQEDIETLTQRLAKKADEANAIWEDEVKKLAEAEAKRLAAEAEAAEEARLEEEERLRQEKEDEEIRVAQEKEEEEERAKKEASDKAMREMRDMFSDVK